MKKIILFLVCLIVPLLIGSIGGIATATSVKTWYLILNKPSFNPPNYIFGPVWTLLYLLMGISLYLILIEPIEHSKKRAKILFGVQITLNLLWSILFFGLKNPTLALIDIILLWGVILWMIYSFYAINKNSALLQIPYLLWVSFATLLNASIVYLN